MAGEENIFTWRPRPRLVCIRNARASSTQLGEEKGAIMAIVTISVKLETDDKIVELIEQLNDRNIDVDVDVDVER